MKTYFLIFLSCLLLLIEDIQAQKRENIWYFGSFAGITFNTNPPTGLTDGVLNTSEGSATISDEDGNLLFYTDGATVYDRNGTIMINGNNLGGNSTTTQSGIIVPYPDSSNLYYVFSLSWQGRVGGLQYAIVDIDLNGGLGEVTIKNQYLQIQSSEKITAVFHENETDIWVVTHGFDNNRFLTYSITTNGINIVPIGQNIGSIHLNTNFTGSSAIGYMKFSPDGNRLAVADWFNNFIEVFDFNRATGELSNPIRINTVLAGIDYQPYGLEFSPNGRLFYSTETNFTLGLGNLIQYSLTVDDIESTREIITTFDVGVIPIVDEGVNTPGALQIGADQKIYFTLFGHDHLSAITNPNSTGASVNIDINAIYLQGSAKTANFGLPNFVRGFTATVNIQNVCISDTTQFSIISNLAVTTAVWNFGDGTPTVNALSPKHIYLSAGDYEVSVDLVFANGANQTLIQDITIDSIAINFPALPNICTNSGALILDQANPIGGTYSGPGVDSNLSIFNPQITGVGTFTIDYAYTNFNGCMSTEQETINVFAPPTLTLDPARPDTVCLLDTPIDLDFISPTGGVYSGMGVVGNQFFPNQAGTGTYTLTYTFIDNCEINFNFDLSILEPVSAQLNAPNVVCITDIPFNIAKTAPSGIFSGTGIINTIIGTFDPNTAGVGFHTINHTYTDDNSCLSIDNLIIEVVDTSQFIFPTLNDICITDLPLPLNTVTPSGGNYFGTGVYNNIFYPDSAGAGIHNIGYTLTNRGNCIDTIFQTIAVIAPPVINLAPIEDYCINGGNINLDFATPMGGVYRIDNNIVNQIIPTVINEGQHVLTYTFTNTACTSIATDTFEILPLSRIRTLQNAFLVCISDDSVHLGGVDPEGGFFTGIGIVNDTLFRPNVTGVGIFDLDYHYINANGCTTSIDYRVEVSDTPAVNFSNIPNICSSEVPIDLRNFVDIRGGIFTGIGVFNNFFIPDSVSVGTYAITYTFSSGLNCTNQSVQNITVVPSGNIILPDFGDFCINADSILITGATPIGGTYILDGYNAASGYFSPQHAGAGEHTLVYQFMALNGCIENVSQEIQVVDLPILNLGEDINTCDNKPVIISAFHPSHDEDITYLWSTGETTPEIMINNLGITTLTVEVRDTSLGLSCTSFDTINITINPTPILNIPEELIESCVPNFVTLNAFDASHTPDIAYLWSNGDTTSQTRISEVGDFFYIVTVFNRLTGCSIMDSVRVVISEPPFVDLGQDIKICQTTPGVIINTFSPSSSNIFVQINTATHLEYLWSTGDTTPEIFINTFGSQMVSVRVTDINTGCFSEDSINITINQRPILDVPDSFKICSSDLPFLLDANHISHNSNTIYAWSTGENTSEVSINQLGSFDYIITVTDTSTGCFTQKQINFNITPPPFIDLGQDITACYRPEGFLLQATNSQNNDRNIDYVWNNGAVTSEILVFNSGLYTVQLTDRDRSCKNVDSVQLTIHPQFRVDLGADTSLCFGNNTITLNVFDTATHTGQNLAYLWNTGSTLPQTTLTINQDTQIVITVFNQLTSCHLSDTLNISFDHLPIVNLKDTAFCSNQTFTLNAFDPSHQSRNITYLWNTGETSPDISINNTSAEIYQVTVTDLDLGCFNEDQAVIGLFPQPLLNLGTDTAICGSTFTINAFDPSHQNNFIYSWNTGETTSQITVSGSGKKTYSVEVINPNTNLACSINDEIDINFLELPPLDISEVNICQNETPKIISIRNPNHPPSYQYVWRDAQNNIVSQTDSLTISSSEFFEILIIDTLTDCSLSQSLQVTVHELPDPNITRLPNPTSNSLPIYLSGLSTNLQDLEVEWAFENENITAFESPIDSTQIFVYQYGKYYFKVKNQFTNCTNVDSFLVYSQNPFCQLPNALTANGDSKNDYFSPITNDLITLNMRIFDYEGTQIFEVNLDTREKNWIGNFEETKGWDGSLNGNPLPEAKYIFQVDYTWLDQNGLIQTRNEQGAIHLIR